MCNEWLSPSSEIIIIMACDTVVFVVHGVSNPCQCKSVARTTISAPLSKTRKKERILEITVESSDESVVPQTNGWQQQYRVIQEHAHEDYDEDYDERLSHSYHHHQCQYCS